MGMNSELDELELPIRGFLGRHIRSELPESNMDLFAGGFANSLLAVQLVHFLEEQFGLTLDNEDLRLENFCSIDAMTALVRRKRSDGT